jgi:hypothetical protein
MGNQKKFDIFVRWVSIPRSMQNIRPPRRQDHQEEQSKSGSCFNQKPLFPFLELLESWWLIDGNPTITDQKTPKGQALQPVPLLFIGII